MVLDADVNGTPTDGGQEVGRLSSTAGRIFQGLAFVVPALASVVSKATVPALIVIVVLRTGLALIDRQKLPAPNRLAAIVLGLLIIWAGLSVTWSVTPVRGSAILQLAGLFLFGLMLIAWMDSARPVTRNLAARALIPGFFIGLLIYGFELASGDWLTRNLHGFAWRDVIDFDAGGINLDAYLINGTAILSLLYWPMAARLFHLGHRRTAFITGIGVVAALIAYGSAAGLIAFAVGVIVWLLAVRLSARKVARLAALIFAGFVIATPLVVCQGLETVDLPGLVVAVQDDHVPESVLVRLFIWKFTAERIAEHPIAGWGFDAARHIPGGGDKFVVHDTRNDNAGRQLLSDLYLPLHPHNQILQIWLELGGIGALLLAIGGALLIARLRPLALVLAASAFVYDYLSFGAWQSWWIATVFIAAGWVACVNRDIHDSDPELARAR